ncbi:MAG: ExbD/TolR family protein [Phycisphaerae bacterium]
MSARTRTIRSHADIRLNLTALVDVTVLLLTFFMVVNQFASAERVEMEIPRPDDSLARDKRVAEPIVINLLDRGPDRPPGYRIGPLGVESLAELSRQLAAARRHTPQLEVVLRADKRLSYQRVREVMELLGEHEVSRFHVVAEVGSQP